MAQKDKQNQMLANKITQLSSNMFEPRMKRLKDIEKEMHTRIEEFAFAEEAMEVCIIPCVLLTFHSIFNNAQTGILCPQCARLLKKPVTLIPCGHTYCKECLDAVVEENFGEERCVECKRTDGELPRFESTVSNEQLENLVELFEKKRKMTNAFLLWMKELEKQAQKEQQ